MMSGCYSRIRYTSCGGKPSYFTMRREEIDQVSSCWRTFFQGDGDEAKKHDEAKKRLQACWDILRDKQCGDVDDEDNPFAQTWWDEAMFLLVTADEASRGIGFVPVKRGVYRVA